MFPRRGRQADLSAPLSPMEPNDGYEIDRSLCSAYGTYIDVAPDLFELADDLIAVARVGETDAETAVEAASACPMGAIRLVEVRPDTTRRAA